MTAVLPPGPFLPTSAVDGGWGAADAIDLAVWLRDRELRGVRLSGELRQRLKDRLADALQVGDLRLASRLMGAFLDTWPAAAMVDQAVQAWEQVAAPEALPVIARSMELVRLAYGWGRIEGSPWPAPDVSWVGAVTDDATISAVRRRSIADGADALGQSLGVPVVDGPALSLPRVISWAGAGLSDSVDGLLGRIAREGAVAVHFLSAVPDDPLNQAALERVRVLMPAQRAYEAYGLAGVLAPSAPDWTALLVPPPAGVQGASLKACCDAVLLPGTPARLASGDTDTVGWLLWAGPHPPLAVHPVAVHVLRLLDGRHDAASVAEELRGPLDQVRAVLDDLVALGAATRPSEGAATGA